MEIIDKILELLHLQYFHYVKVVENFHIKFLTHLQKEYEDIINEFSKITKTMYDLWIELKPNEKTILHIDNYVTKVLKISFTFLPNSRSFSKLRIDLAIGCKLCDLGFLVKGLDVFSYTRFINPVKVQDPIKLTLHEVNVLYINNDNVIPSLVTETLKFIRNNLQKFNIRTYLVKDLDEAKLIELDIDLVRKYVNKYINLKLKVDEVREKIIKDISEDEISKFRKVLNHEELLKKYFTYYYTHGKWKTIELFLKIAKKLRPIDLIYVQPLKIVEGSSIPPSILRVIRYGKKIKAQSHTINNLNEFYIFTVHKCNENTLAMYVRNWGSWHDDVIRTLVKIYSMRDKNIEKLLDSLVNYIVKNIYVIKTLEKLL